MNFLCKWPVATLLLALVAPVCAADSSSNSAGNEARPRISNAELSACVGDSVVKFDDGATPIGDVARQIWQACHGDDSQAVAGNPTAADMLHLRIRAMVTEHRNTVFAARAAKRSVEKAAGTGSTQ
jgi:hypothetical protein